MLQRRLSDPDNHASKSNASISAHLAALQPCSISTPLVGASSRASTIPSGSLCEYIGHSRYIWVKKIGSLCGLSPLMPPPRPPPTPRTSAACSSHRDSSTPCTVVALVEKAGGGGHVTQPLYLALYTAPCADLRAKRIVHDGTSVRWTLHAPPRSPYAHSWLSGLYHM